MGIWELVLLLFIAGICGSVGQSIAGYSRGGCLVSIVVGFVGAYLGSWISVQLGIPELLSVEVGGNQFPIIWSILGSILFVIVVGLFTKRR